MKDTFDLKAFLIENKMTEQSRGDVRKRFINEELKPVILPGVNPEPEFEDPEDMEECDRALEEAGYTDEDDYDDNLGGEERDLDFTAGDALVNKIAGKNTRAKEAFSKTTDVNFDAEEEPEYSDTPDMGDGEESEEEPETDDVAGIDDSCPHVQKVQEWIDKNGYGPYFEILDEEALEDVITNHGRRDNRERTVPSLGKGVKSTASDHQTYEVLIPSIKVIFNGFYNPETDEGDEMVGKLYLIAREGKYYTDSFRRPGAVAIIKNPYRSQY